jgi:hypothetical protein
MICALTVMANWKQVDLCKKFNPSTSTVHSIVKKKLGDLETELDDGTVKQDHLV